MMRKLNKFSFILLVLLTACEPGPAGSAMHTATFPEATATMDICAESTDVKAREKFNFETIIPCLDTPDKVSLFMMNNIEYEGDYDQRECGGNCYLPAEEIYKNGEDDCDGHAILQCYLLEQNGWDATMFGLSVDTPTGHNVCAINTQGKILILDNEGWMVGPFQSMTEIARFYTERGNMTDGGTLRVLKASQVNQLTTDQTSPSVLGLPWTFLEY